MSNNLNSVNSTNQKLTFANASVFDDAWCNSIKFVFEKDSITIFNKLIIILYDSDYYPDTH